MSQTTAVDPERARRASGLEIDRTHPGPAETTSKPRTVYEFLEVLKPELARATEGLPGMQPEQIARLALTTVRRSELAAQRKQDQRLSLAACTPESFAGSLLICVATGLLPDVNGEAYLIPRKGEVTFLAGYLGYTKLFWQHPLAEHIDGALVRANDEFDWQRGARPFLHHKPIRGGEEARGPIIGYYAVVRLANRPPRVLFLEPWEVEQIRGRVGPTDPSIGDPQHWMEVKTVLRQILKLTPKTARMALAVSSDERSGAELRREEEAALRAAIDEKPPAAIEGTATVVNDEPFKAPAPEAEATAETATAVPEADAAPRGRPVLTKARRELIGALREAHGESALAALRCAADDPTAQVEDTPDAVIRKATKLTPQKVAEWQQDQAISKTPDAE